MKIAEDDIRPEPSAWRPVDRRRLRRLVVSLEYILDLAVECDENSDEGADVLRLQKFHRNAARKLRRANDAALHLFADAWWKPDISERGLKALLDELPKIVAGLTDALNRDPAELEAELRKAVESLSTLRATCSLTHYALDGVN